MSISYEEMGFFLRDCDSVKSLIMNRLLIL